ncbi:MAG: YfcC family protein [Firmicutes bacterium]|nr:YfcC family protein [Bacillota bacterium]
MSQERGAIDLSESAEIRIGKKAFITTAVIILCLIILSGVLTQLIPAGSYERVLVDGKELVDPQSFHLVEREPLPVYRWLTAPVEVLYASENSAVVIVISLLILFIGGGFAVLNRVGVFRELIAKIVGRFGKSRYLLICLVSLLFMVFGSTLGMFEEVVALAPLVVILAYNMGWDALLGLGMSLLSICFGFAVAISNPYSIGLSQRMAGLPVFSGAAFRLLIFALLYGLLCLFLVRHARKIEQDPRRSLIFAEDRERQQQFYHAARSAPEAPSAGGRGINRAVTWFLCCFGGILGVIAAANLLPQFADLSLPAIALLYLIAGVGAGFRGGLSGREVVRTFLKGVGGVAPGIVLILMAMSVSFIIERGGVMDTVVHHAAGLITGVSSYLAAYLIYGLVLAVNFFIGSASAKAALLIPILTPLADLSGLTRQTMVLAFCFGDGFSNVFYPTNPVLLLCLGLTTVSYTKWFRWIGLLQLIVLLITALALTAAVWLGYGPF